MYQDLYHLLREVMIRFVKSDIMTSIKNASKLIEVDFTNKDNVKPLHSIDIGFAASAACKDASGLDVLKFREDCRTYLQHVCTKLIAKCPLKYKLVKGATCIDPEVMINDTLRQSRINAALEVFIEKKWTSGCDADVIKREYAEICQKEPTKKRLSEFCRDTDRLDTLLHDIFQVEKADNRLLKFVQQILCLFHGNAAVERSFSINKEFLLENLFEDSLVAQRVVFDAVWAAGGVSCVRVTKPLIHSVRNASSRRIEAAKKKMAEESDEAHKRKRVAEEIKLLEAKKKRIEQSAKEETTVLNDELKKLRCLQKQ